ncbi:uncharacterized membrane protein (UPF0182 family) [Nocardiopsis terrae]|uniref:UPF0182 protein H4W79_000762 n=1 Tax=Nocardiopsis terrae TaxID=372655 RepID=A0ABR9HBZ9_9ACTN|nr:UPF0182 family protein [Nocardiopsis terrae]MBE1456548.1 uncharacterized membrane protein (UPF0182 family) [Nocardiopsis terrae]
MPRRSRLLAPVAATVVVIIAALMIAANFWTDYKWFNSVGYTSVFLTELWTRVLLFAVAGLVMAVIVGASIFFAYRARPGVRPMSLEQQGLDRYRQSIDPHRKLFFWIAVGALALLAGAAASGDWRSYLQFMNGVDFGVNDPEFGMDISFFAFTYPFIRVLLGYLYAAVILAFIAAVVVHYLYGGVRLQNDSGQRATPAARVHLSVLLGLFVLLRAGSYWLDRYGLVFSDRGYTFGASYTDVNAVKTALTILTVISVICAVLFFANIVFKNTLIPVASLGLLVLSGVVVGVAYPEIVQRFQVSPNEQRLESPYIERNIESTREAYGIADAEVETYDATTELTPQELAAEADTIPSVRLADPAVVSQTFQQMQQVRGFYQFPDVLEVDRYPDSEGNLIDTIVAVRELDGPPADQDNWLNRHLIYTHGFGMVAAAGNLIDDEGRPVFTEYNIPPRGELSEVTGEYEPRIYYGREGADYVIVQAEQEYDYPLDSQESEGDVPTLEDAAEPSASPEADEARAPADSAEEDAAADEDAAAEEDPATEEGADEEGAGGEGSQQYNRYEGDGGVELNNFFDRILYAIKYQETSILLNSAITSESRIIYERDPLDRVEKVAPFLTVDSRPYPAVVEGRIVWIVDGYTTSDGYPYANRIDFTQAVTDTFTDGSAQQVGALPGNEVNYIRNSVKATVDAYDGSVTLYGWDEEDPVLQTWKGAFPGAVVSRDDMSEELVQHLRYPDDLFKVQREIMREYHVTDAASYYGGQDFWSVPNDPTTEGDLPEPPYRQTINYPGTEGASFSVTSTFVPRGRENLAAFMAVDSDPQSDDYGQLKLLQLPRSTVIFGPGQVQNAFDADAAVREVLLPLEQSNAEVTRGNLLTLPFAGGLLYVEPLYVQAGGGGAASFPLLQQVMVGFGEEVAIGGNLQEALNNLFEGGEGPLPEEGTDTEEGTEDEESSEAGSGDEGADTDLTEALNEAVEAWEEAQESSEEADERLREALEALEEAAED